MHGLTCDRCGANLLIAHDVRYVLDLRIVAAWDPPELTAADLDRDFEAELARLVAAVEKRGAREVEEEVAARRRFDLCPPCRTAILDRPLGGEPPV